MKMFENKLRELLRKSLNNQFYGSYQSAPDFIYDDYDENVSLSRRANIAIDSNIDLNIFLNKFNIQELSETYDLLSNESSKELLVRLIAFRMLGPTKIKMPLTDRELWEAYFEIKNMKIDESIQSKNYALDLFDLKDLGYNTKLFYDPYSIFINFGLKQYDYSKDICCKVNPGDYVIDGGACFGDTSLYFAHEVGSKGQVFSFEFVPDNLKILQKNLDLNSSLKKNINVIERPLWCDSTSNLFVTENGPASQVFMEEPSQYDFKVSTISIDDYVKENKIKKIDFIKLDIEGAELECLKGAKETLLKHKPKLAICLYHDIEHFVSIPKYINELLPEYEFFIDHYTIHLAETVLYAVPGNANKNKIKIISSPEKLDTPHLKLHVSCGANYYKGWINIDSNPNIKNIDINWDFKNPLSLKPNTVDVIYDEKFFENLAFYQSCVPSPLEVYKNILKPDGVFKLVFPNASYRASIAEELKKLGFHNIEFYDSQAQIDIENNIPETISGDIVVIDSILPSKMPIGPRNSDLIEFSKKLPGFKYYTMYPMMPGANAWFPNGYGMSPEAFYDNLESYLKIFPDVKNNIELLSKNNKYSFNLAYTYFLSETYTLLPFLEKHEIPFVFLLNPGGGFGIDNISSDNMLREIFASKCFRKVIVNQKFSENYLLSKNLCDKNDIVYDPTGSTQFYLKDVKDKKFYKKDKQTFDICFVATKYTPLGVDKGYDLFISAAKELAKYSHDIRFHVVGGFNENDIDISDIKDKIKFYGFMLPDALPDFYSRMDIYMSPDRPNKLYDGNFHGFPLSVGAMYCGVCGFNADDLNINYEFKNDEIVIIKTEVNDIVEKVKYYYSHLEDLYKISKNGQQKSQDLFDIDKHIDNRIKLFKQIIKEKRKKVVQNLKLHIGCGTNYINGWVNIDNNSDNNISKLDLNWDLRNALPFEDNSADFIYNEHFFEHLTIEEGLKSLQDFKRVLKPDGVLRIAMPDLLDVVKMYNNPNWKTDNAEFFQKFGLDFIQTRAEYVNISLRWWGHKWLYDWEELERRLKEAGFAEITQCNLRESQYKELQGLETRNESILIAEASKTLLPKYEVKISEPKPMLQSIDYHVTEHCNLNCKGCRHFCPIAEAEFADIEQNKKDMKRLSELFADINIINIMGGEPLLHKDINEFVKTAREHFPNSDINIITNGILVPQMPESFWQTLNKTSVGIIMSLYPTLEALQGKVSFLAEKHNVKAKFVKVTKFWKCVNTRGNNNKIEAFNKCIGNKCYHLKKGTLSVCGMPHHFEHFNKKFNENIPQDGIFDLHDPNLTGQKIIELFNTPIETCKYCNPGAVSFDWNRSKHEKSEWCIGEHEIEMVIK